MIYATLDEIPWDKKADFEMWAFDMGFHRYRVDTCDELVYRSRDVRQYLHGIGFRNCEVIEDEGRVLREL